MLRFTALFDGYLKETEVLITNAMTMTNMNRIITEFANWYDHNKATHTLPGIVHGDHCDVPTILTRSVVKPIATMGPFY